MKIKRITIVLFALLLCLALAACGNNNTGAAPSTDTPATDEQATGEPSAEPEILKIGRLVSLSGWIASIDLGNIDESDVFVDYINNELGGWDIGGKKYKIEMIDSDYQSDPSQTRPAVEYLADQDVKFVLETADIMTRGVGELFEELGIMHVNQGPNDPEYGGPEYPHMFWSRGGAYDGFDGGVQALQAAFPDVKTLIYVQDDSGSNDRIFERFITPSAEKLGISVIGPPILYPPDATDFSAVALSAQRTGADAYIASGGPYTNGPIIEGLRTLGSDMVGVIANPQSVVYLSMVAGGATRIVSNGTIPGSEGQTQIYNDILARYVDKFGEESKNSFLADAPNTLYILLQMMSIAGSTDVDAVMEAWQAQDTIDTFFGVGPVCGEQTLGSKRAVASPWGRSVMQDDGTPAFLGYSVTYIP